MAEPMVAVEPKSVVKSKVVWFNVIMGAIEALNQSGLLALIPPPYSALVPAVAALGNILLRIFSTRTPIINPITQPAEPAPGRIQVP